MAYLDDRKRVNVWIVALTIPAILFLFQLLLESVSGPGGSSTLEVLHEMLPLIHGLVMISPLFALIQVGMIVRGTAGATWQNLLCVVLTIAASLMIWRHTAWVT